MSSPALHPFVPNDYRKRVLAAVERRGGPDASDVFELYDIPVESAGALPDDVVAARIDEVWAFWQKHRDHPKYRVLVGRLVAEHETRSAALRFAAARAAQAGVVAARREVRDAERYRLLDSAIERLQARYGGIPTSKRAGLDDVGAMGGLTPDEVATRLRRYRTVDDGASTPQSSSTDSSSLTDRRLEQIDELLGEFNRLRDEAPTPTLFGLLLLTLDDADNRAEVQARTESLSQRARELGAGRMRAVIDELLLHVRDVLLGDPATAAAYADAMTGRIAEYLRPRIRAAVLIEDELLAEDRDFLRQEAIDRGAGPVGAERLIGSIAAEFGATVTSGVAAGQTAAAPRRDWAEPLREARGMLREGRPVQARSVLKRARRLAGDDVDAGRQIEAVADEVGRAIRDAQQRWRQAEADAAAGHHASALETLEWLARHASDIDILRTSGPGLAEALENSRRLLDAAPSDVGAVTPAGPVSAERTADGSIRVSWLPSPDSGASYRVVRHTPDGRQQTVGRTAATELEDGGSIGVDVPVYEVTTIVDGRHSVPTRSGETVEPAAPVGREPRVPDPDLPPVGGVAATADRVTFVWPPGVTEVMVVIRGDESPNAPDDPFSTPRKVTITRYELDGGFVIPAELARPCHVAVASCRRDPAGGLVIASSFGPDARAVAADEGR
ncbi:hypothetical protein SAMN04488550_4472 [Gordonia malaquae]|uniref:SaeA fourth Fn3-like domain-containing protein n=1 Tax=Gordonia malaquae NBRC 108250 TaxID=1223542 RepID=M3THP4_GORML|nr:hypothetical protein [Gordonia malaquae]GAC81021.1 hypothetical protein GM1_025_00690 [Gordonia malaquae NBRC 108250]SEE40049.1 hypothetical protein SAMN04488550_4472 [Gordonia malaquae]